MTEADSEDVHWQGPLPPHPRHVHWQSLPEFVWPTWYPQTWFACASE